MSDNKIEENLSPKKENKENTENKINENNENKNNENKFENEKDDNDLEDDIYSESIYPEKKRRNLSQEPKRNKSIDSYFNKKSKKTKKNLENDKEYKQLKEDIDKGNNFIDYFLVIGLSPDSFFDDKIYECNLEELEVKYKDILQPKVISYFPKFDKTTIAFDESIISHCFPNGFKIIKSNKKPKTEIFSFILDNNYFNLEYPQKYLSCLVCYESINRYKRLYEEYKKLSKNDKNNSIKTRKNKSLKKINKIRRRVAKSLTIMNLTALELNVSSDTNLCSSINDNERIFIPKCIMIMSLYPFFAEYEKILYKIYCYSMKIIKEVNNDIDKLTEYGGKSRAMTIISNKNKNTRPLISTKHDISIPIDKIIENLVIELPAPPRGVFKVQYSLITSEKIEIKQSLMNELPLAEVNLKKLFITFELKDIVTIYLNLFLETRILFFSKDIEVLNIFIYGFLSLLFPFQYQYQVVTILPKENFEILESITPFIAGINQSYEDDFFEKRDMMLSDTFLVVDIDKEGLIFKNEQSDIPEFPKNKRSIFEKNLQTCINTYMKEELRQKQRLKSKLKDGKKLDKMNDINDIKNNDSEFTLNVTEDNIETMEEEEDDIGNNEKSVMYNPFSNFNISKEFNEKICDIFFNFNANLLSNYDKYLNLDFYSLNEPPRLELLFQVDKFLKEVPNAERDFYDKFINETQLFGNFIYMRMIPKNSKEKIIILAFDEQINKIIKNKSQPNIFLDSKEYEFCNKYLVQKARKITKKEKDFYTDPGNRKKLLSYGIIIEDKKNNGIISFKYPIFPKLTSELFFLDNFKEYFVPSNLNENIETINEDIISKSHLGGIQTKQDDMINYIYLSWMQMWGMTFWYCQESEQKYWFQELLNIIKKTTSHEMEVYNLLFEALSEYGKENMILKLYDILLKLKLNPSFKVHNMVMKILDKKKSKLENNISNQLQMNLQKDANMKYTKTNFKKRGFKSKYYGKILSDDIMIYAFDTCINCQENINLETLSLNYKDMTRELMWTKCPHCNEYILPKITVQFGDEINKSGKLSINTSKNDCLVLFSPYFLKVNSSNSLVRKFGTKLDVEELMLKYNTIFWNSVWYFKLNNLDFDFMLPYEQQLNEIICAKNIILSTLDFRKEKNIVYEDDETDKFDSNELKIEHFQILLNDINQKI